MGKQVTYTCDRGYSIKGERRIECKLGQWSNPIPQCKRSSCPELQSPNHGTKLGGNRVGDSLLMWCNQGYQLRGEAFLECQDTGEWSHPLPTCIEIVQPERPCDLVTCEVWQRCVIDDSNIGVCRCISPYDCPETEETEPQVCGTDGRNYTSICHLKALACLLQKSVDEASSNWFCINGVPERVQPSPTSLTETGVSPDELSSSSFDIPDLRTNPDAPSVLEQTLPANEGPVTTPRQPNDVDPRSYSFCDADICPAGTAAELYRNATAIVIALADVLDADLGILRINVYEVMSGELPSWTEDSSQEVLIDVGAASERGCLCPPFQLYEPVIIQFTQNLTSEGRAQLLHTDIILPYSRELEEEIIRLLQATPEPVQTPAQGQNDPDGMSISSSFSSVDDPNGQQGIYSSYDEDVITTPSTEIAFETPGPSESSFDQTV